MIEAHTVEPRALEQRRSREGGKDDRTSIYEVLAAMLVPATPGGAGASTSASARVAVKDSPATALLPSPELKLSAAGKALL